MNRIAGYTFLAILTAAFAPAQSKTPQTAADRLGAHFHAIHKQILDMAKDFPEEKYSYKLKPEMRTFADVIVHVASGVQYAAKAGMGEKVQWDELDPHKYHGKTEVVTLLEKTLVDANAALAKNPMGPSGNLEPFLNVLEHSAEHYGLLVAYYRANGLVPPESRPKSK